MSKITTAAKHNLAQGVQEFDKYETRRPRIDELNKLELNDVIHTLLESGYFNEDSELEEHLFFKLKQCGAI